MGQGDLPDDADRPPEQVLPLSLKGLGGSLAYVNQGVGERSTAYVFCKDKESYRREKKRLMRKREG